MNAERPPEEDSGIDDPADVQPAAEEIEVKVTPGLLLSRARQSRGLSIADVARAIKFSPKQIEAIEGDDFDRTSGATTFIRGFIRSYAKFLHIDPQPLLAMLDQPAPQVDDMIQLPQDGGTALPQSAEPRFPLPYWLLPALLAVAAAAVGLIWHLNASEQGIDPPVTHTSELPPAAPAPTPASSPSVGGDAATPPSGNAQPLPAGSEPQTSTDTAPAHPADALAQPAPAASPGSHQLVFTFTQKSWVEVRDATQSVLLSQNNDVGSRQAVSGKPPFALVIGNAPGVHLKYDDREVDLEPHTWVDVARLNLE